MLSRFSYIATVAFLGVLSSSCEKESSEGPKPLESAAPQKQALDPELAQAVAAASARAKGQTPGEAQAGGPPPTGIFAPGAADREAQKGAPPKVTLGADGSEPRVSLQPAQPKPGAKTNGSIQIELQSDPRQGGIPIDFALTLEAQKPKEASDAPGPVTVIARVNNAGIALNGAPPELSRNIGKLKGSKVEYQVLPDGGGTGFKFELAKGADANLEDSVRALSDALAVITLPYPEKPVGVGAYWMATSRDGLFGLDLVTYRLVKVESIEAGRVNLSVNTKRYSAVPTFDLVGLPPDAPRDMREFQALAEGKLQVVPGAGFPGGGEQVSLLAAALGKGNQPGGTLQLKTNAKITFGK
jgi:hypothetical protein